MPKPFKLPFWPVLLLTSITGMLIVGCDTGPSGFDTYDLDFRDTLHAQVLGKETVVVLEQLPDGPMPLYQDIPHEVRTSDQSPGSLLLILDVVGLASKPIPTVFKEARQEGDTLFVWYSDQRRSDAAGIGGKDAANTAIQTSPPDLYLKVTHVTIEASAETDVGFTHRFVGW